MIVRILPHSRPPNSSHANKENSTWYSFTPGGSTRFYPVELGSIEILDTSGTHRNKIILIIYLVTDNTDQLKARITRTNFNNELSFYLFNFLSTGGPFSKEPIPSNSKYLNN